MHHQLETPLIMGIVNVTPDSFSDGGLAFDRQDAIDQGRRLRDEGADILDIGGESSRPGAAPVSIDQEVERVVPVIETLAAEGAVISADTRNARTMAAALAAGAQIINDVSALTHDQQSLETVADRSCEVILMHMQGKPETMQDDPVYEDAATDIRDWLLDRVAACEEAGIARDRIILDPGIGFGKTDSHNLEILAQLDVLRNTGLRVLIGASRKSMIGRLSRGEGAQDRLGGSIAIALDAARRGADIIRVHDVAETRQALVLQQAILLAES